MYLQVQCWEWFKTGYEPSNKMNWPILLIFCLAREGWGLRARQKNHSTVWFCYPHLNYAWILVS